MLEDQEENRYAYITQVGVSGRKNDQTQELKEAKWKS